MPDTPDNICDYLKDQDATLGQELGIDDYRSAATDYFCPPDDDPPAENSDAGYSPSPGVDDPPTEDPDGGYLSLPGEDAPPDPQPDPPADYTPQLDSSDLDYDSGY
jgi:hypothetical protein